MANKNTLSPAIRLRNQPISQGGHRRIRTIIPALSIPESYSASIDRKAPFSMQESRNHDTQDSSKYPYNQNLIKMMNSGERMNQED